MRILITGATGMLGSDVHAACVAAGHEPLAFARAGLDVTDQGAVQAAVARARPDAVINCAAWTDVDGAEDHYERALAANGAGAGHVARAAAANGAWTVHVSSDYVFDGRKTAPYLESDDTAPLSAYGRSKLEGEREVRGAAPERHTIVRSSWLFGAAGRCFPKTILRLAGERDEIAVVADQVGCPTYTGHLAPALVGLAEDPPLGVLHVACAGNCSWFEFAREIVASAGLHCEVRPITTEQYPLPAPRPAYSVIESERRAPGLPGWRDGLRELVSAPGAGARVKLLVCGGAGFIGSTFVRLRVREHGDDVTVLDKLTYAGRLENLRDVEREIRFVQGAIEDPAAVADAVAGADAIVNFAAETHVDRSIAEPFAFSVTNGQGTHVLLEAAREGGLRYVQVSTDEVYGSIASGSFTESSPLAPSSPYSATKTGADLLVCSYFHTYGLETLVCRGSNNYGPRQYPEKLIPLMILNAFGGDRLPVYGDGRNVRNWLFVEDFGRGIAHVLEHGEPGEVYNCGGPDECENIEVVTRILTLAGADESLIEYVTDRPGHDRRYSLSSAKLEALGWRAGTRFEAGLELTVDWYRDNAWWWEPIRSGVYREYYERHYGRALKEA